MMGGKKAMVLTLDATIAMLLLFTVIVISMSYLRSDSTYSSRVLKTYAQDAANVLAAKDYLSIPLDSANASNTSGIRSVMDALPGSVCLGVAAFGPPVTDGLVAYWKMDDDSSSYSAADFSENGFAAAVASPSTVRFSDDAISGGSLNADGSTSANATHHAYLEPASVTVSAWVKFPTEATQTVVSKSGYLLAIDNHNTPYFTATTASGSLTATNPVDISTNAWHHLAGSYNTDTNQSNLSLYVDGLLTASSSQNNSALSYSQSALTIGGTSPAAFTGKIDEVSLYSRALSADEIRELASNPSGLKYSVDRPGCYYSGGQLQRVVVPLAQASGQGKNNYYAAAISVWGRAPRNFIPASSGFLGPDPG